jgi:hypothetical protein
MFLADGESCRTFVPSNETNGGERDKSGRKNPTHNFDTFHEIIYGKPRRRKRAPLFFCPYPSCPAPKTEGFDIWMVLSENMYLCSEIEKIFI